MPNRYANLPGSSKIKDTYHLINDGFDKVQQEMDAKPDSSIAKVNTVEMDADDTLTIEAGVGIEIVPVPEEKKIRIVATGTSTPGPHGIEHNHDGSDPVPELIEVRNGLAAHLDEDVTQDDHPHGIIYERGIFTPEYTPEVGEFESVANGSVGSYVRKNDEVTIYLLMQTSSLIKGTASGAVRITGIPFVCFEPNNAVAIGYYRRFSAGINNIYGFVNNDAIELFKGNPSELDATRLTVDDLTTGGNRNTLRLSVTYVIEQGGSNIA